MNSDADIKDISGEKRGQVILKTLAYFDIFNYPLTDKEIKQFSSRPLTDAELVSGLKELVDEGVIFRINELYSLQNDPKTANKRIQGNQRAEKLLPKAIRIARYLYRFPFVRAVAISGSLSKNYVDEKADVDFFIITESNRLWIARTDLHFYKKTKSLSGKQDLYCMNYFIDHDALLITEQNIYTATEVITLLPVIGPETLNKFFGVNNWVGAWFPNYYKSPINKMQEKKLPYKKFYEWLFNNSWGNKIDNFLFRWTTRRWKKKMEKGKKNIKGKVMGLITDKHFAKSDPESFQQRILDAYEQKLLYLKKNWPGYFN